MIRCREGWRRYRVSLVKRTVIVIRNCGVHEGIPKPGHVFPGIQLLYYNPESSITAS